MINVRLQYFELRSDEGALPCFSFRFIRAANAIDSEGKAIFGVPGPGAYKVRLGVLIADSGTLTAPSPKQARSSPITVALLLHHLLPSTFPIRTSSPCSSSIPFILLSTILLQAPTTFDPNLDPSQTQRFKASQAAEIPSEFLDEDGPYVSGRVLIQLLTPLLNLSISPLTHKLFLSLSCSQAHLPDGPCLQP